MPWHQADEVYEEKGRAGRTAFRRRFVLLCRQHLHQLMHEEGKMAPVGALQPGSAGESVRSGRPSRLSY